MNSESARIRVPVDLHEHGAPEAVREDSADETVDDESGAGVSSESGRFGGGRLWRENGMVMYQDRGTEEPVAVKLVWTRPLSGRNGPVSVMMAAKKKEVAYLPDLSVLSEASRAIALEELHNNVVMPVIQEVIRVNPRFGNFYWEVDTDMGRRRFLLLSPETNTFRPHDDGIIIRDVSGNCYEIASISALSASSRREMDRVL